LRAQDHSLTHTHTHKLTHTNSYACTHARTWRMQFMKQVLPRFFRLATAAGECGYAGARGSGVTRGLRGRKQIGRLAVCYQGALSRPAARRPGRSSFLSIW
jgi:hypothetical protein